MTVNLTATFTALPGHREAVAALIGDFAERVREEPGNIVFTPFTSRDSDHDFVVYEQYSDGAAFQAHLANPAGAPFNASLSEHIVGGESTLHFLEAIPRD